MTRWLVLVVALSFAGCAPLNQQFVQEVRGTWSLIGPQYERYVEADPTLTSEERENEIGLARSLTRLLEEASDAGLTFEERTRLLEEASDAGN